MSQNVVKKQQNFFNPVSSAIEIENLLLSFATDKTLLQLKPENSTEIDEKSLTILRCYNCIKTVVLASHIQGPQISERVNVTIIVDHLTDKYFCTGKVVEAKKTEYVLNFEKIFKLQRRRNFRVSFQGLNIKAQLNLLTIDKVVRSENFRLIDLSAGGFAIKVIPDLIKQFEIGALISGDLKIGNYENLHIRAKIKYRRKEIVPGHLMFYHLGCEFFDMTPAFNQTVAVIVNDCHRQLFSKLKT